MRIAILADIHGNHAALEAALDRVGKLGVDRLIVAGDIVVGGPDSLACWERVKGLRCPVLRGNHERYVYDYGTEHAPASWSTLRFAPVQFAVEQLGVAARQELAALPPTLRFSDLPDMVFVHGSMRNDTDLVLPYTTDAEIAPMFAGSAERWLIRGHNHYAGVRIWGQRRIVTVGSVGLPLDGTPSAQFTVLEGEGGEWNVLHQSVPYDVDATLRRYRETGCLERGGPMSRLFMREVETAAFHIVPFLKWQTERDAAGAEPLPLADAVDAFLRH